MKPLVGNLYFSFDSDSNEPYIYCIIATPYKNNRSKCMTLIGGENFAFGEETEYVSMYEENRMEILCYFQTYLHQDMQLSDTNRQLFYYANTFGSDPVLRKHVLISSYHQLLDIMNEHFNHYPTYKTERILHLYQALEPFQKFTTPTLSL